MRTDLQRRRVPRRLALWLLLACAGLARAQDDPSPYRFGVALGVTRDDNLFRAPDGGQVVSDTISSTGLRFGVDQPISRQRLVFDAQADLKRYRAQSQLNYTDYKLSGRWDWETANDLSGQVRAEQRESQYRDHAAELGVLTEKNLVRNSQLSAQARWGLVSLWSLEAGLAGSDTRYSNAAFSNRDLQQGSVNAGLRWRPDGIVSVRLGVRHAEGRYPNFGAPSQAQADRFDRDDVDLSGTLQATGDSQFTARVSRTREDHDLQSQRDARGWTGALGWAWRLTGKTRLDLGVSRDSSAGSVGLDGALFELGSSDARRVDEAHLNATWEATAKIRVTGRAAYLRRTLDNGFTLAGTGVAVQEYDSSTLWGLGLRYQPTRSVELGCDVGRERRRADAASVLTYPYSANTVGCSVQVTLQ